MEWTPDYPLFVLSVIITGLGLVTVGGVLKSFFAKSAKPTFKKKLAFFPLFIIGVLAVGWLSERIQLGLYTYLRASVATSVSGIVIAFIVAWLLYDWVLWRKR